MVERVVTFTEFTMETSSEVKRSSVPSGDHAG
jgi:hypothetical protein